MKLKSGWFRGIRLDKTKGDGPTLTAVVTEWLLGRNCIFSASDCISGRVKNIFYRPTPRRPHTTSVKVGTRHLKYRFTPFRDRIAVTLCDKCRDNKPTDEYPRRDESWAPLENPYCLRSVHLTLGVLLLSWDLCGTFVASAYLYISSCVTLINNYTIINITSRTRHMCVFIFFTTLLLVSATASTASPSPAPPPTPRECFSHPLVATPGHLSRKTPPPKLGHCLRGGAAAAGVARAWPHGRTARPRARPRAWWPPANARAATTRALPAVCRGPFIPAIRRARV